METTGLKRRLPTPEECIALVRFEAASTTVALVSLGISGVMMALKASTSSIPRLLMVKVPPLMSEG